MTQPTVFDTTNLDSTTATPMAQQLAATMASGQPYSIVGPNAASIMQAAQAINGTSLSASPVAPSTPSPADQVAGGFMGGSGAAVGAPANVNDNAAMSKTIANAPNSIVAWIQDHYANWGLIVLGVILAIGALLISQKDTIVNIAGKVAPLAVAA